MKKNRKRVDYLTQEDKDNAPILLQDIKKIFAEKKVDKIFTCDLAKYLCELPESRWKSYFGMYHIKVTGRYIGKLLNTYGIHSSILKMDKKRLRGYERSHFEERDDWVTSGLKKGGRTSTNNRLKEYIDTVKKVDQLDSDSGRDQVKKYMDEIRSITASQKIAERFLPDIHQ